jgi:hypothetical protein
MNGFGAVPSIEADEKEKRLQRGSKSAPSGDARLFSGSSGLHRPMQHAVQARITAEDGRAWALALVTQPPG